ncbi:MAG: hypothetical protein V4482_06095 [Pseudomonadota bacterium]
MYKFIPFLDEESFWSVFSDYSDEIPSKEHLDCAFNLFYERIKGVYFLPKSQEAHDTLRWYLSPWYPVSFVCKIRH